MKFITKLNLSKTRELVEKGKLSDNCIIPISDGVRNLLEEYLEENTGFSTKPVIGVTKVLGNTDLVDVWEDLCVLIPPMVGDFILEFDMPDDMIATISYEEFLTMKSKSALTADDLFEKLSLQEHQDDADNEVAITPLIAFKFCTGYYKVKDNWTQGDCTMGSPTDLKTTNFFGG